MALYRFNRTPSMSPTIIPSWADPQNYYWGGKTDKDESGGWKEIWHSSFRNPLPDHNVILTFNSSGHLVDQNRDNGY